MKVATLAGVRNNLSKVLKNLGREPLFVTCNGRITAVIEHIEEEDVEDFLLERSPRFRGMLKRAAGRRGAVSIEAYRAKKGA